ncbi:MAG: hypothetical protein HY290_15235 [Planctomycetia bacterium]|nr:hypothetical protein [Planctomycetia bacterium]
MHIRLMSRFPRRPGAWTAALGTLGLAILAAGPAIGWSGVEPGNARVTVLGDASLVDDDGEEAGSVRIYADEPEEAPGSVSLRRNEPEEAAGSVRIRATEPAPAAPGSVKIRATEAAPEAAGSVRIRNASPPSKWATLNRSASAPRKVVSAGPARASHANPAAQRYPFEPSVATARPAPSRPKAASAVAHAAVKAGPSASATPTVPAVVQPVQHQSRQRTPFIDDEETDGNETESEEESAPAMFASDDEDVDTAIAEAGGVAEDAAPTTTDCPAVSEEEIRTFGGEIDATTRRRPIRMLRADTQMRLAAEHSSLMSDSDRTAVREKGRCAAEHDRLVVRQYFQQKYGPGYDRSSGAWWCDDSLAPEFPFCYHPLYFEDPNLERCGYSKGCCCQPLVSGFQFYANVALLPAKMLLMHPCSYVYPQCDCDPCTRYSCVDNLLGPCPCYTRRNCR